MSNNLKKKVIILGLVTIALALTFTYGQVLRADDSSTTGTDDSSAPIPVITADQIPAAANLDSGNTAPIQPKHMTAKERRQWMMHGQISSCSFSQGSMPNGQGNRRSLFCRHFSQTLRVKKSPDLQTKQLLVIDDANASILQLATTSPADQASTTILQLNEQKTASSSLETEATSTVAADQNATTSMATSTDITQQADATSAPSVIATGTPPSQDPGPLPLAQAVLSPSSLTTTASPLQSPPATGQAADESVSNLQPAASADSLLPSADATAAQEASTTPQ